MWQSGRGGSLDLACRSFLFLRMECRFLLVPLSKCHAATCLAYSETNERSGDDGCETVKGPSSAFVRPVTSVKFPRRINSWRWFRFCFFFFPNNEVINRVLDRGGPAISRTHLRATTTVAAAAALSGFFSSSSSPLSLSSLCAAGCGWLSA